MTATKFWLWVFAIISWVPFLVFGILGLVFCFLSYIMSPAIFILKEGKMSTWKEFMTWEEQNEPDRRRL